MSDVWSPDPIQIQSLVNVTLEVLDMSELWSTALDVAAGMKDVYKI